MQSEQEISIQSSESEELNERSQPLPQKLKIRLENSKNSNESSIDSSEDSEIDDLMEKMSSEKESDNQSIFEFENQKIDDDSQSQSSKEERQLCSEIFDKENIDEELIDDEESNITQPTLKNFDIQKPKKITLRDYQKTLFQKSQDRNSIIYLPTGLGKTRIAIASMYYYLSITKKKKIVFLANTVQLVKQQAEAIKKTLYGIIQDKSLCKELKKKLGGNEVHLDWSWQAICRHVVCIHGEKNQDIGQTKKKKIQSSMISKREFLRKFENSTIIVVISQMFLNCLRRGFIKLSDFSFIVFDECHHCKGEHPYAGIMNEFYFDLKKKIEKGKVTGQEKYLPKIMGLTASPIPNPEIDQKKLQRLIEQLCINMDSNFAQYPNTDEGSKTKIQIVEIKESQDKKENPLLLKYFDEHNSHKVSYEKIQYHFPLYFDLVREVIEIMEKRYDCLRIDSSLKQIHHAELFFFYDIKECLLKKIKDIWLELGQYVMCIALADMITQLNNITGIKDQVNQQLLNDIIQILVKHEIILKQQLKFSQMPEEYFSAKLRKLIQILQAQDQNNKKDDKIKDDDLVLVFAFKRRTVEYLDKFFSKYRQKLPEQKRKYFECTGVTGYSSKRAGTVLNEGLQYQTNPSSKVQQFQIDTNYKQYLEDYQEMIKNTTGVTAALQNQLNRLNNAKMGKFLLETQEKYASQLRKITQFRNKQKRVLISTSVTEEGFDIPGCNKVISFDTPFSMKAYIQIKGRARKKNSIYYIFTSEVNYEEMKDNMEIYEDTINATYEIAINRIARRQIKQKVKQMEGYQKVPTKGGALLNSNYALQILKIYFATLAQPNKGYFHYIQTPNIGYKCVIKMPSSDPSGISMVTGLTYSKKDQALKSAAYNAVKQLKLLGLIKDDLRPSRLQQLEDQFQLQKYNDLQLILTNEEYKQIFQTYTQFHEEKIIKQEKGTSTERNFLRIYFKSIRSHQLDFRQINLKFDKSFYQFNNKGKKFPFQLYHIEFSNTQNHPFMKQYENNNQIGILTCFDQSLNEKLFSKFSCKFDQNPNESFTLKKISTNEYFNLEEYTTLRKVHEFLVAGCDNKEVVYYIDETQNPPQNQFFKQFRENQSYKFDKTRQFYPLLVLLRSTKGIKNEKKYSIDQHKIQKIKQHNTLFKQLYKYNNRPKNNKKYDKFSSSLLDSYENFAANIQGNENVTIIQSISNDFLFHKCLIKKTINYSEEIVNQTKKQATKYNLSKRQQKYYKIFDHYKSQKNFLIQRELWRDYEKQKRIQFLGQDRVKRKELKNSRYYSLKEFVQYPISPQTLFKVSLAKKYIYDSLGSYTKAVSFINVKLHEIFMSKDKKQYNPLRFCHYENIILANAELIFEHLADNGKSKLLRQLGRSYKHQGIHISLNESLDKSQIPNLSDISGIQALSKINQTMIQQNSINILNQTKSQVIEESEYSSNKRRYEFKLDLIDKIAIPDIQKVLTSKTYKHQRGQNYQEFQFIGDVILKYLATLQIFCTRPKADQGQMHIARANIICNANLHKKAIMAQIFRYIMGSKNSEPCPPYKITYDESKVQKQKYLGKNNQYESMNIMKVNKASQSQGYQYIAGKVHADVVEALIGAFYYVQRKLQDCQQLLYSLNVLNTPSLEIELEHKNTFCYENLPDCYSELQNLIGYSFRYKGLILQALTHPTFRSTLETILDDRNMTQLLANTDKISKSFSIQSQKALDYRTKIKMNETFYERLEFLGDSVLDLVVVQHLYDKYDHGLDEGTLTLLKQAGVSNKSLGLIALKFKLHQLTLMDIPELDNLQKEFAKLRASFDEYIAHPEKLQQIQMNEIKLLGDVFEGLIGAILVDNDFNYYKTKEIVWRMIGKYIEVFTDQENVKGFTGINYLQNNNYTNCRIQKISKNSKDGQFQYGLIDRKQTVVEKCYALNEKDAWDIIMEIIDSKQKGTYQELDNS